MQFNSPAHALRWAYETTTRPIVKISSVNGMREDNGVRPSSELTPHDLHAQAALIVGMCERVLSPLHMTYIRARFGRDCKGMDILERHMAGCFGTGGHSRRGIQKIIRAYCGEKGGIRDIQSAMRIGFLKAASLRNAGYDFLDHIHSQAMGILWDEMEGRGIILSAAGAQKSPG